MGSEAAIACAGVRKVWATGTERAHDALGPIDLAVAPGEFVVLLGPSGCGKSTLLYLVAGLEGITAGRIASFEHEVTGPSPDRSLIFQETSLLPWLSVWQNVAFGLSIRGMPKAEQRVAARAALQRVGLAAAMDKRPDELSGGMRQRVAVARALAMRPKVLLMDEPFGALDTQTKLATMHDVLLADLAQREKQTVLFVTHDLGEALTLSDRVVVFSARPGRIKAVIPVDLPRPRDPFAPACEMLRRELTTLLSDEVDRAFAEQESLA